MTERRLDHLDPATIAALVDRTLEPAARAAAEAHLAECADCREVWVETSEMAEAMGGGVVASDSAAASNVVPHRPRARRWIYAGAGLAAAAAIALAVFSPRLFDRGDRPELRALIEAVGDSRPLEARLTGGFAWGPYRATTRGDDSDIASVDVREAALELERLAEASRTAERVAARGVGHAFTSNLDRAIADLEEAYRLAPEDPGIASDLSAVYLAQAERAGDGRGELLARAVNAATHATEGDPTLAEAWFNLALALEGVRSIAKAREAWMQFLRVEPSGPWADEARNRLSHLGISKNRVNDTSDTQEDRENLEDVRFAVWAQAWRSGRYTEAKALAFELISFAEALSTRSGDRFPSLATQELQGETTVVAKLAEGHLAYAKGRQHYAADRYAEAETEYKRALTAFRHAGSVFSDAADLQLGLLRYQQRNLAAASAHFARTRARAARDHFTVLGATAEWLAGLTAMQRGEITEALAHYTKAIAGYERAGEVQNVVALYTTAADTLRVVGDDHAGWVLVSKALERSDEIRKPLRRHLLFTNAALYADAADLPGAALALQSASLEAARDRGGPGPTVDALSRRAALFGRLGRIPEATADLEEAKRLLSEIADTAVRAYLSAQVQSTHAAVYAEIEPAAASQSAAAAIEYFDDVEPAEVPRLLLLQGRVKQKLNDPSAESDWARGIALFEQRWDTLDGLELRAIYSDQAWELFEEMIIRLVEGGRSTEAYLLAERARSRLSLASATSEHRAALWTAGTLADDEAALYYCTLPDRVLLWAHYRSTTRLFTLNIPRASLEHDIATYNSAIRGGASGAESIGAQLYDRIIAPAADLISPAKRLVIAADGPLHRLSFVALQDRRTGAYLVEKFAVSHVASWDMLFRSRARARSHSGGPISVLAVSGSNVEAGLPVLAMAEAEVRDVRDLYASGTILAGPAATSGALAREASRHNVVHIAAHARAASNSPLNSYLLLAGFGPSARFYGHQVSSLRLQGTRLIVLAACQTASGRVYRGAGAVSLAQPFLAAGAAGVVASLWDVDDRDTREFMVDFHRNFSRTGDASRALRAAQLTALRSDRTNIGGWAAFLLIGA